MAARKKAPPKKKAAPKKRASKKSVPAISMKENDKWQAEDDLRTLTRAEEIKADKKRMKKASAIAKQQVKTASKFT